MVAKWINNPPAIQAWFDNDTWAISYVEGFANPFDELLVSDENRGRPETAIRYPDSSKTFGTRMLILYGDWREEYAKAQEQGGLEACIQLFKKNIEHMTETSDRLEEAYQ